MKISIQSSRTRPFAAIAAISLGVATRTSFCEANKNEHNKTMNTSIIIAIALAFSSAAIANAQPAAIGTRSLDQKEMLAAITHAQAAAPPKPATPEVKPPAGVTPKRVSPAKFKSEYANVGMAAGMKCVYYLGQRNGRAYIYRSSMSWLNQKKWSDHVIYVELAELDETFRNSLPKTEMKDPK